jgi:hypothetical protein
MLHKRLFSAQYEYLVFAAHSVYSICAMTDRSPAWPLFHGSVCRQTRPFRANSPYSSRGCQDNRLASPPAHHAQPRALLCTRRSKSLNAFPYETARFHSSAVCCMKFRCIFLGYHGLYGCEIWQTSNLEFLVPAELFYNDLVINKFVLSPKDNF